MLCYKGRTFCTGGTPRCADFLMCQRALLPEHIASAKQMGLPISRFVAPESMACYRSPDAKPQTQEEAFAERLAKRTAKSYNRKKPFDTSSVTEAQWREVFEHQPPLGLMQAAKRIGCTAMTIHKWRKKLGYPRAYSPGGESLRKYTEADAEIIARIRKPGEPVSTAARRAGYKPNSAKHIAFKFRDYFAAHAPCATPAI